MTNLPDPLGYLLFPALVGIALSALLLGPYRRVKNVNQPFHDHRRSRFLQRSTKVLLACVIGLFVTMQFFRLPFYLSVFATLTDFRLIEHDLHAALRAVVSAAVLAAELLVLTHLCTYLILSWIGTTRFRNPIPRSLPRNPPRVVVLIPTCDEDPRVLERSVSTVPRLAYPNLRVLIVENSRSAQRKKEAHVVAARYGVEVVDIPNRGKKAGALNDVEALLDSDVKYTVVFDADQKILGDLVTDAVSLLEADEELAVVQTAQAYENCDSSLLACAISQQQMLLYDGIIEGRGALRRAPCYGSNFAIRRSALEEAGGWDEMDLTEDVSTSFHVHARGWASLYLRRLYAMGLTPPTLDTYWKQQLRWAQGNTRLLLWLVGALFRGKLRRVRPSVIVDYVVASSLYVNTFATSVIAVYPAVMLTYGLFAPDPGLTEAASGHSVWLPFYLSLYPLFIIVAFFPYVNMRLRGYPLRNLVLLQGLVSITGPIYLKGVRRALFRREQAVFESSAKTLRRQAAAGVLLVRTPQALAFLFFLGAGTLLLHQGVTAAPSVVRWILVFWMFVHSLSLSHLFVFRVRGSTFDAAEGGSVG